MTEFHLPADYYDPPEPHSCQYCENEEEPDEWACWERAVDAAADAQIAAAEERAEMEAEEREAPAGWGNEYYDD
jgi:hypothetical protein